MTTFALTVPEAGRRFLGLGRDASYAAVKRGELPAVRVGGRLVVPVHAVLAQLGMSDQLIALVLTGQAPDDTTAGPATGPAAQTPPPGSEIEAHDGRHSPAASSSNLGD